MYAAALEALVRQVRPVRQTYECRSPRYMGTGYYCRGTVRLVWPGLLRCTQCKRIAVPEACFE